MLHLHFANRIESLADQLAGRVGQPGDDPFAADTVIVPSAALRRWLTLELARRHGVCAHVHFGFLAQWLWAQIARVRPDVSTQSPFAAGPLGWRVYDALCDEGFARPHPRLAAWLAQSDAAMRDELAQRVAAQIDQTITYRPDWLAAWAQGRSAGLPGADATRQADEAWQAALWRRLSQALGLALQHPGTGLAAALQADPGAAAALPASAHLFALPSMPPLYLGLLQQLGRHIELHVYALNPCAEYWFEVVDPRRLSHLAARGRDQGHEVGNRLLAAWGRQTQDAVSLLVDLAGEHATDDGNYQPHPGSHLLARWQNAVLALEELAPGSVALGPEDRSVELQVCHSLTRELEVLHDRLLGWFAGPQPPEPGDILVTVPDLEAAAPLIDAVFGTAPRARQVPYALTGRARTQASAPARALLALLDLAASRCGASELLGLLQQPIVARRFGLEADALEQLREWMLQAGFHWGLDAAHRAALKLPADGRHTLADALDRLFLGHALPEAGDTPFAGQWPAGQAEGTGATALGAFWRFASRLQALHRALADEHAPEAWRSLLLQAIDDHLLATDDELDDLRELREAVNDLADEMAEARLQRPLPLAVLRAALARHLDDPARGGVPTGRVTFAYMGALRSLPFSHVCLLGLNDGAFPARSTPAEFDLIAAFPQRGDRQRRQDERNLFLDLLLAADDELDDLRELREAVNDLADEMAEARLQRPLPLAVLRAALARHLDDPARGGVPTGRVTFAYMGALRSLPFSHVCLLGLNDGAFPARSTPAEFDLIAAFPQRGDRQRRQDERNLFLDLLLAARRAVHLSCTGRSVRDNAPLPPSVLVSELLEVLVPAIASDPADAASLAQARARLVVEHPLQPFSAAAFDPDGDPRLRSHHAEHAQALRTGLAARQAAALPAPLAAAAGNGGDDEAEDRSDDDATAEDDDRDAGADLDGTRFFTQPLPPLAEAERVLPLERLVDFFLHPAKSLLQRRLNLAPPRVDEALQDDEPFLADGLARHALARRLLPGWLRHGAPGEAALDELARTLPEYPGGALGRRALRDELQALAAFGERVRQATQAPCLPAQPLRVTLRVDGHDWTVGSSSLALRAGGAIGWRYGRLRADDHLRAWLQHLLLCSAAPAGVARHTRWLSRDGGFSLGPCAEAESVLAQLLRRHAQGQQAPLPFYPRSAWAFAQDGLSAARGAWHPRPDGPPAESDDPAWRLALRGEPDPLGAPFQALAAEVFAPLLACLQDEGPADGH